ncbi:alpha/beta fold hydrolase [Sphingomonas sp. NFR15]|uniref:alpha/beta fold hydrolase n=1 Tax=Sphingomonas sp. NFR15 TaxID=1566282 RepID=UPI0008870A70|nr:alpha/beta hydrolase [Sphingomonas sp. NFR15]SDA35971.1 Pimeloyl-ACP methyl ester carboxylesterase [Sphingomonas sp. NFR15]
MRKLLLAFAALLGLAAAMPAAAQTEPRPVIILVHGAFAGSSSWAGVIKRLQKSGYRVIAAANALRSVKTDAAPISALVHSINGPVVLVGHSYGGPVITAAAEGNTNVKALVFVSAFAPEAGETSLGLSGKYPGSTLGDTLISVPLQDGVQDLYVDTAKFHQQFAGDVSDAVAATMAATQRPVTNVALGEATVTPTWKTIPNYAIYGTADRNIPPEAMKFMYARSHSKKTVIIQGASHSIMVSHPAEVASLIETAASR